MASWPAMFPESNSAASVEWNLAVLLSEYTYSSISARKKSTPFFRYRLAWELPQFYTLTTCDTTSRHTRFAAWDRVKQSCNLFFESDLNHSKERSCVRCTSALSIVVERVARENSFRVRINKHVLDVAENYMRARSGLSDSAFTSWSMITPSI